MTIGIEDNFSTANRPELSYSSTKLQSWVASRYYYSEIREFDDLRNKN